MPGRSASRRAFLGAAGAGVATAGMSLDPAQADSVDGGGTSAPATGEVALAAAAPPAIPGTLTKTLMFSDAQGFAVGAVSPLAWSSGAYQPGGGFIDLSFGLEAGAVIKRVDFYAERTTAGSVSMNLNKATVTAGPSGINLDTITTPSGTGVLTGGRAVTLPVAAGEQYYLESFAFVSSSVTFIGAIVTYVPAPLPQTLTPPPALTARSFTFSASKKSVAKGKKVTLSGSLVSASQACLAAQSVLLEKSTNGRAYKPAGTLTTDAGGAFTSTQKVKKKTSYRVSVAPTATCAAAQSSPVAVKVKPRA